MELIIVTKFKQIKHGLMCNVICSTVPLSMCICSTTANYKAFCVKALSMHAIYVLVITALGSDKRSRVRAHSVLTSLDKVF